MELLHTGCIYYIRLFDIITCVGQSHVLQLLLGVMLSLIADIGVLQRSLISSSDYTLAIRRQGTIGKLEVGDTVAGVLSLMGVAGLALCLLAQFTVEDFTGVLLGLFGSIGVVEVGFVASGLLT